MITTIHREFRDTGGMFETELGIERYDDGRQFPYRAFVRGGWGGGVQCFRRTEQEAKAELERLFDKWEAG
jgi:hypothetical protein